MRRYNREKRWCDRCETLMPARDFKYHTELECFQADLRNIRLEKELETLKPKAKCEP